MRQAQRKKEKDKAAIALMLAFCVIALTSIFTIKSNIDKIRGADENVPVSERTETDNDKKSEQASNGSDKSNDSDSSDNSDRNVSGKLSVIDSKGKVDSSSAKKTRKFINPVKSDAAFVTNEFSIDKLIYSVTLDQYMTHCGLDIEAPEDTQVVAAASGTVTAVYEDDRYGLSVEITHENGLVTVYSNLSTNEMVETGDSVEQGKIIGGVGSSALFESLEPAHLHFEIRKDGAYVNPSKYLGF